MKSVLNSWITASVVDVRSAKNSPRFKRQRKDANAAGSFTKKSAQFSGFMPLYKYHHKQERIKMTTERSEKMNEIVERIKKSFALHNIKLTEQKFEDLVPKSKGGNAEG